MKLTLEEKLGFRIIKYLNDEKPHICMYRDDIEIILTKKRGFTQSSDL